MRIISSEIHLVFERPHGQQVHFSLFFPQILKPKQQVSSCRRVGSSEENCIEIRSQHPVFSNSESQERKEIKKQRPGGPGKKALVSCPFPAHQAPSFMYSCACLLTHSSSHFPSFVHSHSVNRSLSPYHAAGIVPGAEDTTQSTELTFYSETILSRTLSQNQISRLS